MSSVVTTGPTWLEGIQVKTIQHSWMDDDELCHIMIDDHVAYCGWTAPPPDEGGAPWCKWNRKAICKDCGLPTCPKCSQLESLERRLEK